MGDPAGRPVRGWWGWRSASDGVDTAIKAILSVHRIRAAIRDLVAPDAGSMSGAALRFADAPL
jgi:hypothetical protein